MSFLFYDRAKKIFQNKVIDGGVADPEHQIILPANTTVNLSEIPNTPGSIAFDTTQETLVVNDGAGFNPISGGGGSPGGPNGSVQFNSSGTFDGDANLTWDEADLRLGIRTSAPTSALTLGNSTSNVELEVRSSGGPNTPSIPGQAYFGAGPNAGAIVTGKGNTSDFTITNSSGADALHVPTGTTTLQPQGDVLPATAGAQHLGNSSAFWSNSSISILVDNTNAESIDTFNRQLIDAAGTNVIADWGTTPNTLDVKNIYLNGGFSGTATLNISSRHSNTGTITTSQVDGSPPDLDIIAGTNTNGGGGSISIVAANGTQTFSQGGNLTLSSGSNTQTGSAAGNIALDTGNGPSSSRGFIQLQDGSQGTAGQIWTSVDTSGSGQWMGPTAAIYNAGSFQSISDSTTTPITVLTNKNYDPNNNFNPSTGVYTCPSAGLYMATLRIGTTMAYAASSANQSFAASITQAGSASATADGTTYSFVTTAAFYISQANWTFNCAAGDTLTFIAHSTLTGSAVSIGTAATNMYMAVEKIR